MCAVKQDTRTDTGASVFQLPHCSLSCQKAWLSSKWYAGGIEVLMGHSEVVMCDFAACLLAELERWMLNASPAMMDLNSFADNSDCFSAPTSALEEVSKRLYSDVVSEAAACPVALRQAVSEVYM